MLMFVFGAGASFDSDPDDRPGLREPIDDFDFRPPLAAGLFTPNNGIGKETIAEFPRAAALLMRLREATRNDQDIEEALEEIAAEGEVYPGTAAQLLTFRAYLARLLNIVPSEWLERCQGLTNYVPLLEQADRWNKTRHVDERDPIACVTFNYDTLLERAVSSVFEHQLTDIDEYTSHADIHVYKPHGSVTWRQSASWNQPPNHWIPGRQGLDKAIREAGTLQWRDEFRQQSNDEYQDRDDSTKVWLPALSIPVRRKTTFTMPVSHQQAMVADLRKVTTVIAVGWRARERHFLRILMDELPSRPSRLVAVAETNDAAQETIDNLWETGRFDRFSICGTGFSGFAATSSGPFQRLSDEERTRLTLRHVLTGQEGSGLWMRREPGRGLTPEDEETLFTDPGYADL